MSSFLAASADENTIKPTNAEAALSAQLAAVAVAEDGGGVKNDEAVEASVVATTKEGNADADADADAAFVDLTADGGVRKRVLVAGDAAAEMPVRGNAVQVHYTGTLAACGTEFDTSRHTAYPFAFVVGEKVIKGWDAGVKTMRVGERCELRVAAAWAYGAAGCEGEPPIPPDADLVFDIELLAVDHGPETRRGGEKDRLAALKLERAARAAAKEAEAGAKAARKAAALAKLAAKKNPKGKNWRKKQKKEEARQAAAALAEAAALEEKKAKKARRKAKKAKKKKKQAEADAAEWDAAAAANGE